MQSSKNAFDVLLSGHKRKRAVSADILVIDSDDDAADGAEGTAGSAAGPSTSSLAPIFRSPVSAPGNFKEIICVRHGHTNGYHLVDTGLSMTGESAASSLLSRVPSLCSVHCIVTSPLTRALHTVTRAWKGKGGAGGSTGQEGAGGVVSTASASLPLYITPLAAERVSTVGDVGRSVDILLSLPALSSVREEIGRQVPQGAWWRGGGQGKGQESSVTGAGAASASSTSSSWSSTVPASFRFPPGERAETLHAFRQRVGQLRAYLRALPHSRIALVAHANTIMELTGSKTRLDYCQVQVYKLA